MNNMKLRLTALLLTVVLLVTGFVIPAVGDSWPTYLDYRASMWTQTKDAYMEDAGMVVYPSTLGEGVYVAPRVYLNNNTEEDKTFRMYWVLDKTKKINFNQVTVSAGKTKSSTLSGDSAKNYYAEGQHTLEVYVDDVCLFGYSWYVMTAQTPVRASAPEAPAAVATPAPTVASERSTKLTFKKYGATSDDVVVSGLVWRYRKDKNARYAHKGNRYADAAHVKKIISKGGEYGLNYKITFTKISGERSFNTYIVVRSPDGFEKGFSDKIFIKGVNGYWSFTFMATDYFPAYMEAMGDIKSGDYTFYLYLDKKLANVSTLRLY